MCSRMHCKCCIYCTVGAKSCFAVYTNAQVVVLFPQAAHLNPIHFSHLPEPYAEHTQHTYAWSKDPRWIQFAREDRSSSATAFCSAQPMPKAGISPVIKTPPALLSPTSRKHDGETLSLTASFSFLSQYRREKI